MRVPDTRLSTPKTAAQSSAPDVAKLACLIKAYAPHDGSFELRIPGVHTIRRSRPYSELVHGVQQPALCVVAQGAKRVMVGREVFEYDASRMIAFSVDLPVTAQVTRASHSEPFLCFRLDLDRHKVAELVLRVYPHGLPRVHESRGVSVGPVDMSIVAAATRLVDLIAQPGAELLAPLVIDEILIRLLLSSIGARVAQIGVAESGVHGIAKAVSWLRANFSQPMKVEELADLAHMSASSFHQHFKAVTSMSPLQYQKVLRLQEARRLMLSTMMDAGSASRHVGYVSASQFSREYGRFFGSPPTKDISTLREHVLQGGVAEG
ncbi:MAG TPA: AraC family transcriptional regulator [Thermoanaerobaculaceae bacterium]|nr:AraC family transcriptional regulator [Thermoanaerobaculaceae bacterium]